MATLEVVTTQKKKVGEVNVADALAVAKPNAGLIFDAVQATQTNRRVGTACTKTRGEVRGGGRKPYKQKGTGNARQGSTRSPIFVGGGQTFGPRPRPWHNALPKKQRVLALAHAIADRVNGNQLIVVDSWGVSKPKTKDFVAKLAGLGVTKALIILDAGDDAVLKSARNIPGVDVIEARLVNAEHIIRHAQVIVTKQALEQINARVAV